jgi:acyl-CoA dehydrogenase
MQRETLGDEHDHFRLEFRRFANPEIVPCLTEWNQQGRSDPEIWRKMGEAGYLAANAPEEYGGAGADFLFDAIVIEELADLRAHAVQASVHTDICMP